MLKSFTLKNGIRVCYYHIPQMKATYLSLAVRAGSIFDTKAKSGVAHFMEHILVQAIPSFPNVELLSEFIEGFAGNYNASTSTEVIYFKVNIPSSHLEEILRISAEVFYEPLFRGEDIQREKGAINEEIRQYQDSTNYKISKFWYKKRFLKGHPLLLDSFGSIEVIDKLKRSDLIKFWSKFFHPKNTYLTLVGNLPIKKIKSILEKNFGKYQSRTAFSDYPNITNDHFSKRGIAIRNDQDLKACYIDLSFPSVSAKDLLIDRTNQMVVLYILGGLRQSRLYKILRLQRGLVYYVNAYGGMHYRFGYADIYSQALVEKVEEVISIIVSELKNIYENGPLDKELEFTKNYYTNQILMYFDNPSDITNWIESNLIWDNKIYTPEQFCKIINKVDKNSILAFMKKYWDFSKLNLTLQGPIDNSSQNLQKYIKILEVLNG